jgi:hypothetical protein
MSSLNILDQLVKWRESLLCFVNHGGPPKSLVLWGNGLRGVALWVKYAGPRLRVFEHLRYQFLDDVRDFGPKECDYVVFEDFYDGVSKGVKDVPYFRQFFKPEEKFVIHPFFSRKRRLKWGKPAVLLTHRDPFEDIRPTDAIFLRAYCHVIHVPGWS